MEEIGILKLVKETKQFNNNFQTRRFVITTLSQYPQVLEFELQKENCDIIDAYSVGQEIKCSLEFRGREWTNQQGETVYFNTIVCWKIQPSTSPVGGN